MITDIPEAYMARARSLVEAHQGCRAVNLVALAIMETEKRSALPVAGLTRRQAEALEFIDAFQAEHGCSPTFSEIAEGLGLVGKSGAHRLVTSLIERGRLHHVERRARSLVIGRRAA